MTTVPRITILAPSQGMRAREHHRQLETLRFADTYANVKRSGIANTNQELGADSVNRVHSSNPPTRVFLPKGASA